MEVDKRTNTWMLQVLLPASAILGLDKDASGVWFALLCEKAPLTLVSSESHYIKNTQRSSL